MADKLLINLQDLLRQRTVEGERIEYKTGWNPDAIVRTICAFANDFENLGGGYLVIGQDCDADGKPVFPPVGLSEAQLDKIQRDLLSVCQSIQPPYFPVLSIEVVEGRSLIVLWAPGGQNRHIRRQLHLRPSIRVCIFVSAAIAIPWRTRARRSESC